MMPRLLMPLLLSFVLLTFSTLPLQAQSLFGDVTIVHFETASAELGAKELAKLDQLAEQVKGQTVERILIEGYCDVRRIVNDYAYDTNQQLSQARAYNVAIYLQNRTGLPATAFTRYGYGASKMIADNNSATGMAANRRVEVRVFLAD